MPRVSTALALVGVVLLVAAVGPVAVATTPTYDLGRDHGLATDDAIQHYAETGVARASIESPAVELAVVEEASTCGLNQSLFSDARNDYLCIDWQQETSGTLRVEIPGAYFHPFVRESKQSIRKRASAAFRPTRDGNATEVVAHFDSAGMAVWAIPEDVTASYVLVDAADTKSERWFDVPLWAGLSTSWQHINDSVWNTSDDPVVALKVPPSEAVVQYDATPNATEPTWLPVPDDPSADAPVYRMHRADQNTTVYVVAETSDPPPVRYKRRAGALGRIDRAMSQLAKIDDRIAVSLDDLVPDVSVGLFEEGS